MTFHFSTAPDIAELGFNGFYFLHRNLNNIGSTGQIAGLRESILAEASKGRDKTWIENDPVLQGFRDLHTAVERSNRKYVSSPENMLQNLLDGRALPSLSPLVDIYNLGSLQTRLALGAHDMKNISGNVRLALTDGTEKFVPLGKSEPKPVGAGEYCYIDDDNDILCRMEVRQVEKTKITPGTTDAFFIVQGNRNTAPAEINDGAQKLMILLKEYCGGEFTILHTPT